ncbi:hypothetical protein CVT25_014936 [Psilocybe cyanescens]|uniref:DNA repair protein RAD14 n=1 Tax=Psilocybe cyanescens TaxID=93625 RepID=A0A409XI36_PSICY|nr:hypothetical protein CVT25_014936 [Psilocybe cyanescens]
MSFSNQRTSTPPPRTFDSSTLQATPEYVKQIEINRLKAKAIQRQKEQDLSSSYATNSNNKRPLSGTPTTQGQAVASSSKPLQRDSRLGTYFEYDLSKMVNSKGGFLMDDGKKVDEELRRKEKEREKQRDVHNLDIPMFLDSERNAKCKECNSMDIDPTFMKVFKCLVCKSCQNEHSDKYSLLTKTECKTDYLLTDPELRDEEAMPHLLKANPHASTYANMMLFLRCQVEDFAWKKWGSPEALDAEFKRRTAEKDKKKNKKFEQSLKELRKRTKEGVWQRRKDAEHKHVFSQVQGIRDGIGEQERTRSPIALKSAKGPYVSKDGIERYMYWMKARDIPRYEAPFQKCILAYESDLNFISTAGRVMGLKRGGKGPDSLSMNSTLDHAICNDFDAGDWLLYEIDCPRGGSGRAIVHGRMFTRDGTLVAVTTQEGVVRANRRGPVEEKLQPKL